MEANTINWVGQDLTLHMDGHPAGPILIHKEPTHTSSGVMFVHFRGSGLPPFWADRPQSELIEELRNRKPVVGAQVPYRRMKTHRRIREVLKDRDGMTDAEIDKAIESLNDNDT